MIFLLQKIKKNTVAMMCHKIGNVLVNSTDNLLISKFVSIVSVGLYSNYSLILINLNKIVSQIFSSMTASIGNFNVSESDEKKEKLFLCLKYASNIFPTAIKSAIGKRAQKKISGRKKNPSRPSVAYPKRNTTKTESKETNGYKRAAVVSFTEENRHMPTFSIKSKETYTKLHCAKEKLSGRNAR